MLHKLLCRFGHHAWSYHSIHYRACLCCDKQQKRLPTPWSADGAHWFDL